jgi:hypothetical protein
MGKEEREGDSGFEYSNRLDGDWLDRCARLGNDKGLI